MEPKSVFRRVMSLIVISLAVLGVLMMRLVEFQLVKGDEYRAQAESVTNYNFVIPAARGEIVDRYGRSLASNAVGYNVVVNKLMLSGDLNQLLVKVVEILKANGETWNDTMPIGGPVNGHYEFTDGEDTAAQKRLKKLKDQIRVQQYATADQVMEKLVARYKLEEYDAEWQRILAGIRYQMQLEDFSENNNFTLAQDVSNQTVATIKERSLSLQGVDILETTHRIYEDGTLLPHYLGSVGSITSEQWWVEDENGNVTTPLKDKKYNMNDLIGQSGVERYAEDRLRGKPGRQQVSRDKNGVIVGSQVLVPPKPGETVVLTVDRDFQKKVNEALANHITTMQNTKKPMKGQEVTAGAIVVMDVKTGGILAIANYPSYDLNLYQSNYSQYSTDPNKPLLNRATTGLYTPGSTFKPSVALSGLLNSVITPTDTIQCNHVYEFFDYRPVCLNIHHNPGSYIDMVHALTYSCNTYFYDLGWNTGMDVFNETANDLGLGVKTGFELNEATGNLTHTTDKNYTTSLQIQAAIGQANTQVTPLQLATYANTIANNGVRYKAHIISNYRDSNTGEVIEEVKPEVMAQIEDKIGAFDVVEQGMLGVARDSWDLKDYPLNIAIKTGSPQRWEVNEKGEHYVNSALIAYGPVEDPQIAIGAVLEWGGGGSNLLPLVKEVFDLYYDNRSEGMEPVGEGVLLP